MHNILCKSDNMNDAGNRLAEARKHSGYGSARDAAKALGVSYSTYAGHENGSRGIPRDAAEQYARRFKFSLDWLYTGVGAGPGEAVSPMEIKAVPLVSWISAGSLAETANVDETDALNFAYAPDLDPSGDWIALRVDGRSMDKISPHDSIIFVNRKEKMLVPNGCYIISDGDGGATYKRYRPPNKFEPVSTKPEEFDTLTFDQGQEPEIIGRVRKTVLSL